MKNNIRKILELIGVIIFCVLIAVLGYYIDKLQYQVNEREKIILEKTKNEDKLRKSNADLIESLTNLLKGAKIKKDGTFDVKEFIKEHNKLVDSVQDLKWQLDFINREYGLHVIQRYKDKNKSLTIKGNEKIDSALVLLPYFRDRIKSNKKDTWTINLTGEEYDKVRKNYEDNMFRYNSLVDNYNNLIKDHKKLVKQYNDKVDFYRNMLTEMSKKGLIKIDSSSQDIMYEY